MGSVRLGRTGARWPSPRPLPLTLPPTASLLFAHRNRRICPFFGVSTSLRRPSSVLSKACLGKRQFTDALSSRGKNRVAERRSKRRKRGFTNSRRWRIARHDIGVGLPRSVIYESHLKPIEIGLVDYTVGGRDFSIKHQAYPHHRAAFNLLPHHFRIYDRAGVQSSIHAVDAHLARIIHLHLHHS